MAQEVRSVSATPFPVRPTSFIGRVAELRGVRDALDHHRLVTLVGPGGAGKTRLAIEATRAWDGGERWYVDLAPVDGDEAVDAALAVATGAPEGVEEAALEATVRWIGDTTGLMLIDNCDVVIDACAKAVHALLGSCPRLSVLTTSREPLRVEGERVVRVPPLSLAEPGGQVDGDAVLLFLDRANLAPEVNRGAHAVIAEICRRLDGMPLAIELAASRAASLPVPDILFGLEDRFRLLADGPRTADRRQRSLAASIQWSYRLLGRAETVALQRLSVFRSPFTSEAARPVLAGEGVDERDVVPLLARLVERSFVAVDERGEGARYRLLETIRAYAGERLAANPSDVTATRNRHLRYLRDTAERMAPVLRQQSPRRWLDRLESELPDIRAAVSWAAETGNADNALRLVGALSRFWWVRARSDGGRILEQALAIEGGDPRWRSQTLVAAALAAVARFDPKALDFGRDAVRSADECGDPKVAARAHCELGWVFLSMDLAQARVHLERAADLARDVDDPWTAASVLNGMVAAEIVRNLPLARARADDAVAVASSNDDRVETCAALVWSSNVASAQGRVADVEARAERALSLAEATGASGPATNARAHLAQCAAMRGNDRATREHLGAMDAAARASDNPLILAYAQSVRAVLTGSPEQIEAAHRSLLDVFPTVPPFRFGMYAALMSDILTDAALAAGDIRRARACAVGGAEFAEAADIGWARSRALLSSARVDATAGEAQSARRDLDRALERADRDDDRMTTIEGLELLAGLELRQRSPVTATRLAAAAAAERSRLGYLRPLVGGKCRAALLDQLRSALGSDAFEIAWTEGGELSLDDAVTLARRGRGSRRRPMSGWDSLTPAERRVVALVGDGLTNPQIAAKLFVTTDTVKGHVSAALRKLGVANRAELAAEAARREAARGRSADATP